MSIIWSLAAAVAAIVGVQNPVAERPQPSLAIVGADVLPMTDAERLSNQTILIGGDRILAVGPSASVSVPAGVRRIDATGLTLMPGLVDMHVHLPDARGNPGDETQSALAVMLAYGITTARGMAGAPINLETRDAVDRGEVAGPRIYAASPPLNDRSASTPDDARRAVRKMKELGFDLIKSHYITNPAVWEALQDEARTLGIPTAGHVTNEVGLARAMAAAQQVEHLDGAIAELMRTAAPNLSDEYAQFPPADVLAAAAAADESVFDGLARRLAAARSYQVPTLSLFEKIVSATPSTEELMRAPSAAYVPAATLKEWAEQRQQFRDAGFAGEQARNFTDVRRRLVRSYARAGVPLMAGSDTPQFFHVTGPALIEEIQALAKAGLRPIDALKAATVTPRDYFRSLPNGGSAKGWRANFGTVEPMARADLILLRGDPSRDLSALSELETVIAGGKVYDRAALKAMLAKAATDAKAAGAAK